MFNWDKYKKPPAKIYVKKYVSKEQQEQTYPKNKILRAIIKALKFAFISILMIIFLCDGTVDYDRKWYEWVVGSVLFISLIMLLSFLFHRITGFSPI